MSGLGGALGDARALGPALLVAGEAGHDHPGLPLHLDGLSASGEIPRRSFQRSDLIDGQGTGGGADPGHY